jgi:plasmid stabilization system protein ParE
MIIRWTNDAEGDLSSIRYFIESDSLEASRKVVLSIIWHTEQHLALFPNSGKIGRVAGTREFLVPKLPYFVPYRVNGSTIEIIGVYHTSQAWPEEF